MTAATATEYERQRLQNVIAGKKDPEVMEYKGYLGVLENAYVKKSYEQDPTNTSIFQNSSVAKMDATYARKSVGGAKFLAKKYREEGIKQGQDILKSQQNAQAFSENYYGDRIINNVNKFNPFTSVEEFDKLEKAKPLAVQELEQAAKAEIELERIKSKAGTETPPPGNRSLLSDDNYLDNFSGTNAVAKLLKSCIPCEFRIGGFTAEFGVPWLNTLEDLKKKWRDLLALLRSLTTFRPGEFSIDLCNLFKFLDGQCIPDITGLLSLLSLMQLKYLELGTISLDNILAQLIAPFLTPIIGSFTTNLDQYVELILAPLKCIVRSLEFQINALQGQINGAMNIANVNRTKFHQAKLSFVDSKAKSLRNRKMLLQQDLTPRDPRSKDPKNPLGSKLPLSTKADFNAIGRNDLRSLDSDRPVLADESAIDSSPDNIRQSRIIKTKLVKGGININSDTEAEVREEIEHIDDQLRTLSKERKDIIKEIGKNAPDASNINKENTLQGSLSRQTVTAKASVALRNMEAANRSIMSELTAAINDGIGIISQSVDIYREEFQRLVLGRISTQEDQAEFTRTLQKFARLGSIVATVAQLKKNGIFNLKKLCEQGPGNALAQIAKGIKENNGSDMYDFYQATDADGNPLVVITPGGSGLSISSVNDNEESGDDAPFGDSSVNSGSITTTVKFSDLNEVDKLNRQGIVPDLGNIDSKNIELSSGLREGSSLDLHFKSSYAIISNEFCSKSVIDFGSSDTVKKWAENLWQKR